MLKHHASLSAIAGLSCLVYISSFVHYVDAFIVSLELLGCFRVLMFKTLTACLWQLNIVRYVFTRIPSERATTAETCSLCVCSCVQMEVLQDIALRLYYDYQWALSIAGLLSFS